MGEKTQAIRNTAAIQTSSLQQTPISKTPTETKTEQAAFKAVNETVKQFASLALSLIGRICIPIALRLTLQEISQIFIRFVDQPETKRSSTVETRDPTTTSSTISTPEGLNTEIEENFSHLIDPQTGKLEAYRKDDRKDVTLLFDLLKPKQGDSKELKQAKQDKMKALLDLPQTANPTKKTNKTQSYDTSTKIEDGAPRKSPTQSKKPSFQSLVESELKTKAHGKKPLSNIAVAEYIEELVQSIRNNGTENYLTSSENPEIDFLKIQDALKIKIDSQNSRSAAWTPDDFLEFAQAYSQKKASSRSAEDIALTKALSPLEKEFEIDEITDESGTKKMVWKGGNGSVDEEKSITFQLLSEAEITTAKRSIDELFELESVQEQFRDLFDELQ
jgi:hypothetical protein